MDKSEDDGDAVLRNDGKILKKPSGNIISDCGTVDERFRACYPTSSVELLHTSTKMSLLIASNAFQT